MTSDVSINCVVDNKLRKLSVQANVNAIAAIRTRLDEWSSGADCWLSADIVEEMRNCFRSFCNEYKDRNIFILDIVGWECGLGQVFDIRKKSICTVLPFLLTSYIYNFHGITFVRRFLKEVSSEKRTRLFEDDALFGVHVSRNPMPPQISGIGKLLNNQMDSKATRTKKQLDTFSQNFCIPKTKLVRLREEYNVWTDYIVPCELTKTFNKKIERFKSDFIELTRPKKVIWLKGIKSENIEQRYASEQLKLILSIWYDVICTVAKTDAGRKVFACQPDPLYCLYLFQQACEGRQLNHAPKYIPTFSETEMKVLREMKKEAKRILKNECIEFRKKWADGQMGG